MSTTISTSTVAHIASLSNIPITKDEEEVLAKGFTTTLNVVDQLMNVDTKGIEPTHQVTGLENVFRDDEIDKERTFSQEEALMNAKETHQGFFVVPQIIGE